MQPNKSSSHAVFSLRLHVVFVTKYRRKVLTPGITIELKQIFSVILEKWKCSLIEFGAEEDHVHLLIEIHPALNISTLMNNLKSASSRRIRNRHADYLATFYWKPYFWHRAYYVGTVGNASLETVRKYVENQNTKETKPPA
ncbi:putative transposase [Mariprofundus micogutta]|uniref:Putative transposase n=2 Tax=Mariprofundus micogutta TaxID=1921010 RepID=A0A1L8CLS9_9PROT|nr:putative transposase [Mariprofundus micogutta]